MGTRQLKYKEIPQTYVDLIAPSENSNSRKSLGFQKLVKEFYMLDVDCIIPYKKQARRVFDEQELQNLAETIKEHGIRQPLSVIKSAEEGKFEVISGERRLRAAKIAGLDKVPCIIVDATENIEEIALIENIQRADLHPVELANAYESLLQDHNRGDKSKLAQKLGVSNSHITETLKISGLPQEIKDVLVQKNIRSRHTIRRLCKTSDVDVMRDILGIQSKISSKKWRREIISFFVNDGHIEIKSGYLKLSDAQKKELKSKMVRFLEAI